MGFVQLQQGQAGPHLKVNPVNGLGVGGPGNFFTVMSVR